MLVACTGVLGLVRAGGDLPFTPDAVREMIRRWGMLGPVIFAGAFALRPFIFFPSSVLFVAGGLAFGVAWGTVYATLGATSGAVVGFMLARTLGAEFVRSQLGDRVMDALTNRWGAGLVLLLNLIPVVPMTAINYGAGLSGMELLPFTTAVLGGITPRALAYSFFGHSLHDIGSMQFVLAVAFLALLVVVPLSVRRYLSKSSGAVHPSRRRDARFQSCNGR